MNTEFNYYRVHSINDDNIPMLMEDDDCPRYLYEDNLIKDPGPMNLKLRKPVPKKINMADYLTLPHPVVSKKISDALASLNIEGLQLLPSVIRGNGKEIHEYVTLHIPHRIKCVDSELSECVIEDYNIENVVRLVLDKKLLKTIPLEKRLVFRLKEDCSYELFHESVVQTIMSVNPTGIRFTDIEKWNEGSLFD